MLKHRLSTASTLSFLLLFGAAVAQSQTASLVLDINPAKEFSENMAEPLATAHGKLFFSAPDSSPGQMWVTDGSSGSVRLLGEACPGGSCSFGPSVLGSTGRLAFWISGDGLGDATIWRSDGTRPGTFTLASREAGVELPRNSQTNYQSVVSGDLLYFVGCQGEPQDCGLWRTDGSRDGTRRLHGSPPTPPGAPFARFSLSGLTAMGTRGAYFADRDASGAWGLWKSDGTAAGTVLVRQFSSVQGQTLAMAGTRLFLAAEDGDRGFELWVSDGTAAGTRVLTELAPRFPFLANWIKAVGDHVYFEVSDENGEEIWASDGTRAGTRRVTELADASPFPRSLPSELAEVNGRLLFLTTSGSHDLDLWSTTGTPESTAPVATVCSRICSSDPFTNLLTVGGRVLFMADDGVHGAEPWSSDGTPAGTALLRDICPGSCSSSAYKPRIFALLGRSFFLATDGDGYDWWSSNGTPAGTRNFTQLPQEVSAEAATPITMNGNVFFTASNELGAELWVSDGSPGGSRVLTDGRGSPFVEFRDFQVVQDRLLFTLCEAGDVWQSRGSAETTAPLLSGQRWNQCHGDWRATPAGGSLFFWQEGEGIFHDSELWAADLAGNNRRRLATIEDSGDPAPSIEFRGRLFSLVTVSGPDITHHELWESDGTEQGTRKIVDVPSPFPPAGLTVVDGLLYFEMADPLGDYGDVWRTDGTAEGTLRLNTERIEVFEAAGFVKLGSWVYFLARQNRPGLWRTDGTAAGTTLVHSLEHFEGEPGDLVVHAGALYFFAESSPSRVALWRSNGTEAGTVPVRELGPFSSFFNEQFQLTVLGGKLFFVANDSTHGHELWQSDGTAQGTRIVKDIDPGAASSSPTSLRVAAGRLYFAANDPVHGIELWQSDGTEAGTKLVQDIKPESASSAPEQLTVAGNRLFFTADDGFSGRELWALPLDAPAGCQPSPGSLCLSNGRFKVEALWLDFEGGSGRGTAVPLTADTGYFWFFGPDNVEVMVKVLDGRGLNDHHWVFYGALSSVEFALTVTDTQTGASRRYLNPLGQFASVGDTEGFGRLGASFSKLADHVAQASPPPVVTESWAPAVKAACQPAPERLCLGGGRFAVEARWKDFQGQTGSGTAVGLTGDTGYFWFFGPENVEVVLKVLDGTAVNGKHWVFFGALSNVEYTLTVTDTATGKVKTYTNPSGRFASFGDTDAF